VHRRDFLRHAGSAVALLLSGCTNQKLGSRSVDFQRCLQDSR